jgi:hypothetical protein
MNTSTPNLPRSTRARNLTLGVLATLALAPLAHAGEHLLGYVKSAEPLPKGGQELYFWATSRDDKGQGTYHAIDYKTEYEYGVTDRFMVSAAVTAMSLDTSGLIIDGYLPQARKFNLKASGLELEGLYNILSPAKDNFGLSTTFALDYSRIDKHSGQRKDTLSAEFGLTLQKYFLEGQLVWLGNVTLEATWAKRAAIADLPADFDWPTSPEMEIEPTFGTGLSYRFAPNWYVGAETVYQTEFETEVGQERWSWFAGPSLHYGSSKWWATLTYFRQLAGGGEMYTGQTDTSLHLIEKTKSEVRLKVAFNF